MRDTFIKELTTLAERSENLTLITADLGFGVLDKFNEKYPNQYLNVGVAEQNMCAVAAGMALEGHTVFTYSIGNFPTLRCLEQIRNDICYHDLNVKIVAVGGGFSYGVLGMSHHATEDLSIMRALPNMMVFAPCDVWEVTHITRAIAEIRGPAYLRLDKSYATTNLEDLSHEFTVGKARILRQGDDVTLIACGGIMQEVLSASVILENHGINARILSFHTIKPIDKEAIKNAAKETRGLVVIEENNILGGLGGAVAETCFQNDIKPGFCKSIGIQDNYSEIVGTQEFLRSFYKIDSKVIAETTIELLGVQDHNVFKAFKN